MKHLPVLIMTTLITTSCAQMMASFRDASPDKTEENIPKIHSLIKKGDMDGALNLFQEGLGKIGDVGDKTQGVAFYDKKGNKVTVADSTFLSHKKFVHGVKKLQGCLEENVTVLDKCLKNILNDKELSDFFVYRYPTDPMSGRCLDNSDKATEDHINCSAKYGLVGIKKNICGKPYTYMQPRIMQGDSKARDYSWGGPLTSFVLNSSYTSEIKELKSIRSSRFCKN